MASMRWLDRARRTSARIAALAALACAAAFAPAALAQVADRARLVIRDPHYGDTLFHFYRSHYFSAVTGLMAAPAGQAKPLCGYDWVQSGWSCSQTT